MCVTPVRARARAAHAAFRSLTPRAQWQRKLSEVRAQASGAQEKVALQARFYEGKIVGLQNELDDAQHSLAEVVNDRVALQSDRNTLLKALQDAEARLTSETDAVTELRAALASTKSA